MKTAVIKGLFAFGLMFSLGANAQKVGYGKHNLGVGFSINELGVEMTEILIDEPAGIEILPLPDFHLNLDFHISEKFSFGFGTEFQTVQITDNNFGVTETISSFGGSLRPLYHFVSKEYFNFYAGVKAGFEFYTSDLSKGNTGYERYENTPDSDLIGMVITGFNTYFTDEIGMHLEAGVGTQPYYLSIGLSLRF